ncbi:MAG: hypothetical protein ACI4IV_01990 [Acutalibacteraceae bacterium]
MAKYNPRLSGAAADENAQYSKSVKRLKNFLKIKEQRRQMKSPRGFGNPAGSLFKAARVLIPILSLYLLATLFIFCGVMDMQHLLEMTVNPDVPDPTMVINLFSAIAGFAVFVGNILLLFKKYRSGGAVTAISSAAAGIFLLIEVIAQQSGNLKFNLLFYISAGVYILLGAICAYIPLCLILVKRRVNALADEVLLKISRQSEKTGELMTPAVYSEKIEDYLKKEMDALSAQINLKKDTSPVFSDKEG